MTIFFAIAHLHLAILIFPPSEVHDINLIYTQYSIFTSELDSQLQVYITRIVTNL